MGLKEDILIAEIRLVDGEYIVNHFEKTVSKQSSVVKAAEKLFKYLKGQAG